MDKKEYYAKINQWKREKTDRIQVDIRKEDNIPARIEMAVATGYASSRQMYIINAIKAQLERDGIPETDERPAN